MAKRLFLFLVAGIILMSCGNRDKTIVIGVSECSDDLTDARIAYLTAITSYLTLTPAE